MEQRLKSVLEYQRFSPNKRLSAIIADVESRYCALSDEALSLVSAAGDADAAYYFLEKKDEQTDRNI